MSPWKTRIWRDKKNRLCFKRRAFCALIRAWTFCHICRKHISPFLHNLKTLYEYKHIEKTHLGKHCLLHHKPCFTRLRHILQDRWNIKVRNKHFALQELLLIRKLLELEDLKIGNTCIFVPIIMFCLFLNRSIYMYLWTLG